jgi:hypothetical protein
MASFSPNTQNRAAKEAKKAELIALGYPWPDSLDDKSVSWLVAEIVATAPVKAS